MSDEIGNLLSCLLWMIFPALLYVGAKIKRPTVEGVGKAFLHERKKKGKSRAQLEDEMHLEYGTQPMSREQARHFARLDAKARAESDANYNEHARQAAAWTMSDTYISAEGHKVDIATNQIVRHNVSSRRK